MKPHARSNLRLLLCLIPVAMILLTPAAFATDCQYCHTYEGGFAYCDVEGSGPDLYEGCEVIHKCFPNGYCADICRGAICLWA